MKMLNVCLLYARLSSLKFRYCRDIVHPLSLHRRLHPPTRSLSSRPRPTERQQFECSSIRMVQAPALPQPRSLVASCSPPAMAVARP